MGFVSAFAMESYFSKLSFDYQLPACPTSTCPKQPEGRDSFVMS